MESLRDTVLIKSVFIPHFLYFIFTFLFGYRVHHHNSYAAQFLGFDNGLDGDIPQERVVVVGLSQGQLLTVVYTERGERLRIISARKATKHEQDDYYRQNAS